MAPSPKGWVIKPAEASEQARVHRAYLRGWVTCGERPDYAWVDLDPPMLPSDSGIPDTLGRVLLAPRPDGVFLNDAGFEWPAHVYVATAPPILEGASEIPPDALKIRSWGVLVGEI